MEQVNKSNLLDEEKFNEYLDKFVSLVNTKQKEKTDKLSFQEGFLQKEEGYKRQLYKKYGLRKDSDNFPKTKNVIKEQFIEAVKDNNNNIINRWDKEPFIKKLENEDAENLLYQIYTESPDNDEQFFNEAMDLFGHSFPKISFIFFLKDSNKYVPANPVRFSKNLKKLGADTSCLDNGCTWGNYQKFLDILKSVRDLLIASDKFSGDIELIDAHSFVWMLHFFDDKTNNTENENIVIEETGQMVGRNILYYGVPGSGKSHKINETVNCDEETRKRTERVVFHPEYTYSDFVGQILPKVIETKKETDEDNSKGITYEFCPGPFTRILKDAYGDEDHMYYLVIEEINRGNAPAIFGDIFQLLDRKKDGGSEYEITNSDIAGEVYGKEHKDRKIKLPFNLTIYATMNTSDQNVFTLDTAFQRRWDMELVPNNIGAAVHAKKKIEKSQVTWENFATTINDYILSANDGMLSSEDKRLGAYFINEDELSPERFSQKVLKYLWDDAFKMKRELVFKEDCRSLEDVVKKYKDAVSSEGDPLEAVFKPEVYKKMKSGSADTLKGPSATEVTENHTEDN